MSDELNLVRDLAIILISAGVFTIISKALDQPLVLGYIVAGFLVGPHITFFPSITSVEVVNQWSEIGIIFMMFALGLEFSFKRMLKVGTSAIVIAGVKFLGIFVLGFVIGKALGWTSMESVFLAGLLSMSSTAVVLKSYDDLGLKEKRYASTVFGTLVVEDLIAIVLMVLLSTMAVSNSFSGIQTLMGLVRLAFFLVLWFLVGIFLLPSILEKFNRFLSDEIMLLVSIGLCFGMVTIAQSLGFSSALGAFVMGSLLSETNEGERVERLTSGIKNLFSAVFFISVGMMLDPGVVERHWGLILFLTVTVVLSHAFFAGLGVIISRKGLDDAVHVGFSLSQLGEFGFIIAGVGVSLGVMRDFIYPVIIAVSVITTFFTPFVIRYADKASLLLENRLPDRWKERLMPVEEAESEQEISEWKCLLKAYFTRIILYSILIIAILIISKTLFFPLFRHIAYEVLSLFSLDIVYVKVFNVLVTMAILWPFIHGLAINTTGDINKYALLLLKEKAVNFYPILGLILLRFFLAISFVIILISDHFFLSWWAILLVAVAGLVFFFFARRFLKRHSYMESHFLNNLHQKDNSR